MTAAHPYALHEYAWAWTGNGNGRLDDAYNLPQSK